MKTYALSVLYVFSVALAVGIGMAQVGKEEVASIGGDVKPDCGIYVDSSPCDAGIGPIYQCAGKTARTVHPDQFPKNTHSAVEDTSIEPKQCVFDDKDCSQEYPHLTINHQACETVYGVSH